MKKWEVWIADVPFDDREESKIRPVLIIDPSLSLVLTFKITSKGPRNKFPAEYAVIKWKEAGLSRPSVIRGSRIIELSGDKFKNKLGKLQKEDIRNFTKLVNKEMPEYSHLLENFIPDDDPQLERALF